MKKTLVVNLYGGPGSGKSTGAAFIFSRLKLMGINCELVTEFAKDVVWSGDTNILENQFYVTAMQYERIRRLLGKVDVVITDSPLLMGKVYDEQALDNHELWNHVRNLVESMDNMNVRLIRVKKYEDSGRLQTLDEAKAIDGRIYTLLHYNKGYISARGDESGYTYILNEIIRELHKG